MRANSRFSSSICAIRSGSNRAISIPASLSRSSPRPRIASLGSSTPMTTRPMRLSMIRSTHAIFGGLRPVQGSKVVNSVAPASVSSRSFFSNSVNSACSPGASSPRNASPITMPSRATTAPTFGETLPGSLTHWRAIAIARSMSARSSVIARPRRYEAAGDHGSEPRRTASSTINATKRIPHSDQA